MADKIVQQITPVFDEKAVKDFSKKIEKVSISSKFTSGLKSVAKIGGVGLAGITLLGTLFKGLTEEIGNTTDAIDKMLAKADELGTLAGDIGVSSGKLALFTAGAGTVGLNQEDFSKIIASVQQEQVSGSLSQNYGNVNVLDTLALLQARWKVAGKQEKVAIEKSIGLRGKKASEFLQSDINSTIKLLQEKTGATEPTLTSEINKLADLEGYQAQLKQETELIDMKNKSNLLTKETLDKQANYQRSFNKNIDEILKQSGNIYDKQAIRENAQLQISLLMNEIGLPLLNIIKNAKQNMDKGGNVVSSLWNAFKSEFSKLILGLWATIKNDALQMKKQNIATTTKDSLNKLNPIGYVYDKFKGK